MGGVGVAEVISFRMEYPGVHTNMHLSVQESGWLLDGYPRSASQAEAIEKEGIRPDVFLLVNVSSGLFQM